MKVHPAPNRRNVILPQFNQLRQKKLRRLPHIFAKVIELPFYSDADVVIHESSESFRFVVDTDDDIGDDIRAQTIEIHPGVTKIVVQGTHVLDASMELDVWRFRLPSSTRPELATAAFSDGELVVTVPKGLDNGEDDEVNGNGDEVWGESNGAEREELDLIWLQCLNIFGEISQLLSCYGRYPTASSNIPLGRDFLC